MSNESDDVYDIEIKRREALEDEEIRSHRFCCLPGEYFLSIKRSFIKISLVYVTSHERQSKFLLFIPLKWTFPYDTLAKTDKEEHDHKNVYKTVHC